MGLRAENIYQKTSIRLRTHLPGPNSLALMKRREKAVVLAPTHTTPLFISKARGAVIEDVDGNRLIDLASGIGVTNLGHCSDLIVKAIKTQADRFLHAGFNVTPYELYVSLCEKLNEHFPNARKFPVKTFLANSGAEALKQAIQIARISTGRSSIICFDHTYMALSMGVSPFEESENSRVFQVPFPYVYRWPGDLDETQVAEEAMKILKEAILRLDPSDVAAIVIEPILSEGGFVPAPLEFLRNLQELCARFGILLIVDEVQSGFGRTGSLFACDQLKITPDILVTAKGLGGGVPIAAVSGRAEILDAGVDEPIGSSFGGNPLSCAAALAVFETFDEEEIVLKALELGETLGARLAAWKDEFERVGDVRGLGAMRGLELVKNRATKEPDSESTQALIKYAYEHGVVMLTGGKLNNVVRLLMPLVIEEMELDEALNVIEDGLRSIS